ncbi:MAG TPA: saccharopine dehydrogenase NADP-binding domain-containing protein [Solirubrobacterales bacterium]|nr:saccharopine dehydrogenase NADP-binding domain-containing protein [Solirubrobacterales bacterium]
MRVAVLGAGGTIAPAIVRDLAESQEVTAMRLLDLDVRRAEAVAVQHGGGKAEAGEADANSNLAERLAGVDVLINSAHYPVNLAAMEACLEVGCHYMDLGGLYHVTARQLEYSSRFEQGGRIAILGAGSAPGKTNLMAARAVRELGGEAESVSVAAAGRDLDPPGGMAFPYAVRTLIAEISRPPIALIDGRPRELEPMQAGPRVDFGDPVGEAETIFTLHSEVLTFGDSFGAKHVTFALSLSPQVLELLQELAAASEERVAEAARAASPPSPNTVSAHVVEVVGGGRMVRAASFTPANPSWQLGGGVISTGSVAAAATRLLARGEITARGALPPERCIDPERMFAELESRGVRFEFTSRLHSESLREGSAR